jgi:hypothetical protein
MSETAVLITLIAIDVALNLAFLISSEAVRADVGQLRRAMGLTKSKAEDGDD